ncbi:hypothetical protein [Actinoplanes xinjiangensis]|uniref:hypothetical protein n=1 Tax=Actinoplanes xinjiangensis TaxID=512350 RepID=UPI00344809E5
MLGRLAAHLTNMPPSPSLELNGLLYGIAGTVAIRADFCASPGSAARGAHEIRAAASLVGKGMSGPPAASTR